MYLNLWSQSRVGWFGFETLKALANFSPGFALKPWVIVAAMRFFATLKGLRRLLRFRDVSTQPFQGCVKS